MRISRFRAAADFVILAGEQAMSILPIHYISYDRFPAPKGAAIHIDAFVRGLAGAFSGVRLYTVASGASTELASPRGSICSDFSASMHDVEPDTGVPHTQMLCPGVEHIAIPVRGVNLIQRVMAFRRSLSSLWPARRPGVVHFRSIFEGYPIARAKSDLCERIVYEVNGLPSIELKYHYPGVADDAELLRKVKFQEQYCLEHADLILTVSSVGAAHLLRRGASRDRLRVIPNGVDTSRFHYRLPREPSDELQILYVGTWSTWQGLRTAIEALALYVRDQPARLTIVGEGRRAQATALTQLARRLGVRDRVCMLPARPQAALVCAYHASDVALAPLPANDRNLEQGCCPLKILEAMAAGTPLVASDLPVTRELVRHDVDALLVRPGSAKAIKEALLRLRGDGGLRRRLSASARRRAKQCFTWQRAQQQLVTAYEEVLGINRSRRFCRAAASREP